MTVARVTIDTIDLDGHNDIHRNQTLCIVQQEHLMECHFRRQRFIRLHQRIYAFETCL